MTGTGPLTYRIGFGNELESEAEPGIAPRGRNSPEFQRDYRDHWQGFVRRFRGPA